MKISNVYSLGLLAVLALGCPAGAAFAADEYPAREVTWVVPAGPGGGSDILARTVANIIQDEGLVPYQLIVENRPGGAGSIGYTYLSGRQADPYYISAIAESFFTTPLMGQSTVSYKDFTPVAGLASDLFVMVSAKESGIASLDDLRQMPAVRVGTTGAMTGSGFLTTMLQQSMGIEMRNVPFGSDGEVLGALLGGHVDIQFGNPAEILGQVEAGELVPLAVSSPERSALLPDVPTFKELGVDVELTMTRGVIMPKDVPPEAVAFWEDVLRKVSETEAWRVDYVERNGMIANFLDSEAFGARMVELNAGYEENMRRIGAIQ
ncbi:MAG: hypothetical protein ABS76_11795 [Pelagibacterium sp. SCN 64-44]|nr:MAG: hypothetical protein ABS76_11795 [Pelagibacterium sp. SCN 64-44]